MRRGFRMSPERADELYELEKDRRRDVGTTIAEESVIDERETIANDEAEDDEWADWLDEEDDL